MSDPENIAEQFDQHLGSNMQSWLLGAGVSYPAKIPLMIPLTERVIHLARSTTFSANEEALKVIDLILGDIPEGAHIEIFLSHLNDLIAMADRARNASTSLGGLTVTNGTLRQVHKELLVLIADTIRWGYFKTDDAEEIGSAENPIVDISGHRGFVASIFSSRRAGLENRRGPVEFFSTNYDTLLEDALALNHVRYADGFTGGGVGYWSPESFNETALAGAIVTKLHGSIDWHRASTPSSDLYRVRNTDTYPEKGGDVMIYPQATKYEIAQTDPFAHLFQRFRTRLSEGRGNVLLICGYSFGDDHINADIEVAMAKAGSQLTLIAFVMEDEDGLPKKLQTWRLRPWKDRVFVATDQGLYRGDSGPHFKPSSGSRDWWTFSGVANLLENGLPFDVRETLA